VSAVKESDLPLKNSTTENGNSLTGPSVCHTPQHPPVIKCATQAAERSAAQKNRLTHSFHW
jgi:hypothetical protein